MNRVGPLGRLSRSVDHAVRWRLGLIGVLAGAAGQATHEGVEAFWAASRMLDPVPVTGRPMAARKAWGTARLVDISG
ncbi:MAG TPA: hypothetical protein VGE42_09730, partial [Candidatus Dormibacteraeota bacterium]